MKTYEKRERTTRCTFFAHGIHRSTRFKCEHCYHHHCQSCKECPVCDCDDFVERRKRVYTPADAHAIRMNRPLREF